MMSIAEYPRCAGYLKAMRFKLDDPTMTDYGWAVKRSSGATLADLLTTLRGMSKKQRQSARTNIAKVPAKWRAGGHS